MAYIASKDLCLFKAGNKVPISATSYEEIDENLTVGNQFVTDVVCIAMDIILDSLGMDETPDEYTIVYRLNGVESRLNPGLKNVFSLYMRDDDGKYWVTDFMHEGVFMTDSIVPQKRRVAPYTQMASEIDEEDVWVGEQRRVLESEFVQHTFRKGPNFIRLAAS